MGNQLQNAESVELTASARRANAIANALRASTAYTFSTHLSYADVQKRFATKSWYRGSLSLLSILEAGFSLPKVCKLLTKGPYNQLDMHEALHRAGRHEQEQEWWTLIKGMREVGIGGTPRKEGFSHPSVTATNGSNTVILRNPGYFYVDDVIRAGRYLRIQSTLENLPALRDAGPEYSQAAESILRYDITHTLRKASSAQGKPQRVEHLARCLQELPVDAQLELLRPLTGVREQCILLVPGLSPKYYSDGFRSLATNIDRSHITRYIQAKLDFEHLKNARPKHILNLLYSLPWAVVRDVCTQHRDSILSLMAPLLSDVDSLSRIRMCLHEHRGRPTPRNVSPVYAPTVSVHDILELLPLWDESMEYNARVRNVIVDPDARFLFYMTALSAGPGDYLSRADFSDVENSLYREMPAHLRTVAL